MARADLLIGIVRARLAELERGHARLLCAECAQIGPHKLDANLFQGPQSAMARMLELVEVTKERSSRLGWAWRPWAWKRWPWLRSEDYPPKQRRAPKRDAVQRLLTDPANAGRSYRELARKAGVSPEYVSRLARAICQLKPGERLVTRKSTTYRQKRKATGNKGKKAKTGVETSSPSQHATINVSQSATRLRPTGRYPRSNQHRGPVPKAAAAITSAAAPSDCGAHTEIAA
jgi:hypothetical protein